MEEKKNINPILIPINVDIDDNTLYMKAVRQQVVSLEPIARLLENSWRLVIQGVSFSDEMVVTHAVVTIFQKLGEDKLLHMTQRSIDAMLADGQRFSVEIEGHMDQSVGYNDLPVFRYGTAIFTDLNKRSKKGET